MADDKQLIRQLNRGSADALGRIFAMYKDELLSLAIMLCRDRTTAEDVLQDVFVQLAGKSTLTVKSSLKGYLVTSVVNRIRSLARVRQHPVSLNITVEQAAPTLSSDVDCSDAQRSRQITEALDQLPNEQQEAIILHLHSGLTFKAIAKIQDVSINTAQSRYRYGLDKLRNLLNSEMER